MTSRRWWPLGGMVAVIVAAATGLGVTCGSPPPPSSDICEVPPDAFDPVASAIEIGHVVSGQFVPYADGDVATLVTGGQGASMIVVALRVTGTNVGACLPQTTALEDLDGTPYSSEEAGLVTYPDGTDRWRTGDILLPYYGAPGARAVVRSHVGINTQVRWLWIDQAGEIDGGIDTIPSDGCVVHCGADAPSPADAAASVMP